MSVSLVQLLTGIANAIREKKGTTGKINAQSMAFEIATIEPPLGTIELKDPGIYDVKEYKYAQVLPSDVLAEFIGNLEGTATEIHIPEETTKLRGGALYTANELTIYLPTSVKTIDTSFAGQAGGNSGNAKINIKYAGTLQEWYDTIPGLASKYYLFINNELVTEINSITNFNRYSTAQYASIFSFMILERIFIPNGSTISAKYALSAIKCKEIIFEGTINGELTERCLYANNYAKQEKIILPTNITTIPKYCLGQQSMLKELFIPEGVTTIDSGAFYEFSGTLYLPSTLTSIGTTQAYAKTVVMNCVVPPTTTGAIFSSKPRIIYIPAGTLTLYQTATNWSAYSDVYRELNEIALNVQAEIVNNETYQYSLDGGVTWSVFASGIINLEQIALIKFKNTSETTKLLIGKTAGATDIGSITDAELSYATEGSMTIYLRLEEITA